MPQPPAPTGPDASLPRAIHRVRASGAVMGFAILGAHMVGKDYGWLAWGLLALQSFAYPQLLHWRVRRSQTPLQTGLENFLLDAFTLGLWSAGLGYPLWIAFTFLTCNVVSITLYGGTRRAAQAAGIFFLGGLLWLGLTNRPLELHTDWPATILSMVGLVIFLLMTAGTAFRRNRKLVETRAALRQSEQTLQDANAALHRQLGEIHALQGQLHELVNRDALTGLYNRRYLDSTLERELARCKRDGIPLSLLMIDIDRFKQINDTYGHQAGDEVLKALAAMLDACARAGDVACRYGGEEFLLLLPGMPADTAYERAGQWRAAFAAQAIDFGKFRMHATLSIGIATYPGHGTSPEALLGCADAALYQAKAQGRDRVVMSAHRSAAHP